MAVPPRSPQHCGMLPTILCTDGYWFFVSLDRNPDGDAPMVGVVRGRAEATVLLGDVRVASATGFAAWELRRIRRIAREHRRLFLRAWHDYTRRCDTRPGIQD